MHGGSQVGNPSIGEVSLGASLSLGSACHLGGHDNKGGGGGAVSNSSVANLLLGSGRGGGGGGGRSSSSGGGGSREDGLEGCSDRENASVTAMAGTSRYCIFKRFVSLLSLKCNSFQDCVSGELLRRQLRLCVH